MAPLPSTPHLIEENSEQKKIIKITSFPQSISCHEDRKEKKRVARIKILNEMLPHQ